MFVNEFSLTFLSLDAPQTQVKLKCVYVVYLSTGCEETCHSVCVCEKDVHFQMASGLLHSFKKAALNESWFASAGESLCVWAACERGTVWTLNHSSRI